MIEPTVELMDKISANYFHNHGEESRFQFAHNPCYTRDYRSSPDLRYIKSFYPAARHTKQHL